MRSPNATAEALTDRIGLTLGDESEVREEARAFCRPACCSPPCDAQTSIESACSGKPGHAYHHKR